MRDAIAIEHYFNPAALAENCVIANRRCRPTTWSACKAVSIPSIGRPPDLIILRGWRNTRYALHGTTRQSNNRAITFELKLMHGGSKRSDPHRCV